MNRERAIFNSLKKEFGKDTVISPDFLRVEQVLSNNKGSYTFPIETTSGQDVMERKLDRNDLFVITDLGIYLLREADASKGAGILHTYPNEVAFPAAAGFTPAHLEVIYNGKFSMKIQSKVNIEGMSMRHFRHVPETQQSAANNKSQYSYKESVYELGSLIKLHGTMNVEIKIDFNTFAGLEIASVVAGTNHKLVFHPYGYLIKGAALKA